MHVVRLGFVMPRILHALIVSVFAVAYDLNKHKLPEEGRTNGVWFLMMAFVFPVMYLCLTPLALVTLGTTSWETRGGGGPLAKKSLWTKALERLALA